MIAGPIWCSQVISRAVAGALLVGAIMLIMPVPAAHADQLEISSDGRTWVDDLSDPLFDPGSRWVPGDEAGRSFWVRNAATTAGDLSLTVDVGPDDELVGADVVDLRVRTGSGDWMEIDRLGQPQLLQRELAPGEQEEIFVTARYLAAAGNQTQRDRTELRFTATLTDDSADEPTDPPTDHPTDHPTDPPTDPPTDHPTSVPTDGPPPGAPGDRPPGGDLPDTGAGPLLWLLPIGAAAIGSGAALLRRNREGRDG